MQNQLMYAYLIFVEFDLKFKNLQKPLQKFEAYRKIGLKKGFLEVVSGPMVRSSYRAERALEKNNAGL